MSSVRRRSPPARRCAPPCPRAGPPWPASAPCCWRRRRRPGHGRASVPSASRRVSTSARAWQGCAASERRLTTGTSKPLRVEGGRHPHEDAVVEDPGAEDAVVAGQRAGHVLGRLARVQADLVALDVDGMPTEVDHGHLGGVAGAGRRLLEEQRHALAGQSPRRRVRLRQRQHPVPAGGVEIVDVEASDACRSVPPAHSGPGPAGHQRRRAPGRGSTARRRSRRRGPAAAARPGWRRAAPR